MYRTIVRSVLPWAAFLGLFFARESIAGPKFKANPIPLQAEQGVLFDLDLRTLLSDQGAGTLEWSMTGNPAWVQLDSARNRMFGTPGLSDVGLKSFRLGVQDQDTGAIAQVDMRVVVVPKWKNAPNDLDLGIQKERELFRVDLREHVTTPDTAALVFSADGLAENAPWLTLTPEGILSGTPQRDHVGDYSGIVFTARHPSGGFSRTNAKGTVLKVLQPPKWVKTPIPLPDATEDVEYGHDVKQYVLHSEPNPLVFEKISGPDWVQLNSSGLVSGTPRRPDVGTAKILARVFFTENGQTLQDTAELEIKVIKVNKPPRWTADPLLLPNAFTKLIYQQDLKGSVTDPDGDTLTFNLIQGPAWVSVTPQGLFRGTPQNPDVGTGEWIVEVTDGEFSPRVTVRVVVIKSNEPPQWLNDPTVLPNAKEDSPYAQNLKPLVTDPDNDPLTFTVLDGPEWLTLTADGMLTGTPGADDLGKHVLRVRVDDNKSGNDIAEVHVTVDHVNHKPFWTLNPIRISVKEDDPMRENIAQYAKDPDKGDTLKFHKVLGPEWATLSQDGVFTGRPGKDQVGESHFTVRVTDQDNAFAETQVVITVIHVNHPPQWSQDPVVLPNAPEDVAYSQSLVPFVKDPDTGDTFTFTKLTASAAWISVSPSGEVTGTPRRPDVGPHTFKVRVMDQGNLHADVTVQVTVVKVNKPPKWKQDPIDLGNAFEDKPFQFELGPLAEDFDGDPLSFSKVSGPAWLNVAANGRITGTPGKNDVGNYNAVLRVSDGKLSADVGARGVVIHTNHTPVIKQNPISFEVKERETFQVSLNDPKYVEDSDGDALTFSLVTASDWVTLSSAGDLVVSPLHQHLGTHTFQFEVRDAEFKPRGTLSIKVVRNPRPPVWLEDPIRFQAKTREPFTATLAGKAKDLDNLPISFFKKGGPNWLRVGADGNLSGTPQQSDLGENEFVVTVKNDALGADAKVIITVVSGNKPPYWLQDPILLPDATQDTTFHFDLKPLAKDDDNDPLQFRKVSGPAWLFVGQDGKITGTPGKNDVGEYTAVFEVTDGIDSAQAGAKGKVLKKNHEPIIQQQNLKFTVKARETLSVNLNDKKYIEDLDGDKLTFRLIQTAPWVALTTEGQLTATPGVPQIGNHSFQFEVSDGEHKPQARIEIEVLPNPRPPIWLEDPIRMEANVNVAFNRTLADKAKDLDNLPLTFSKLSGPAWLTVAADGKLTGTPRAADIGENTFGVRVASANGTADATLIVNVVSGGNNPPFWLQDPLTLPNGKPGKAYTERVAQFARDPDGNALTFSKVSGPAWAFVTSSGLIIGTPNASDAGLNVLKVRASDPAQAFADVTVNITVEGGGGGNRPPRWTLDPIPLGDAVIGRLFSHDLAKHAVDDDGDPLSFRLVQGPAWLTVRSDGFLSGTPRPSDVGEYVAVFEVSDGKAQAQAGGFGKVVTSGGGAPIWNAEALNFIVKERSIFEVNINDPRYITDPDGDTLTFKLMDNPLPDWLTLSSAGQLVIKPLFRHIGDHRFTVRATDTQNNNVDAQMFVRVLRDPRPPVWLEDPLRYEATVGILFQVNISDKVKDLDGLPLTFSKKSGPGWLSVNAQGTLSGTPQQPDLGENRFVVTARNDQLPADVTVIITVKSGAPHEDKVQVDKAVPGAPAEYLWVVDNSWGWFYKDPLVRDLQANIGVFYQALNSAQLHHTGVFLSTDASQWDGQPVKGQDGSILLRWDDNDLVADFRYRTDRINVNKCYNSPLWSMFRFYQRVPSMWEIYHNGYMEPEVPNDAMIVTKQLDQYRRYAQGKPQQNWTPVDYADYYISFHNQEKKAYRVSAIAAKCPQLEDPWQEPTMAGPENAYKIVVDKTKGKYYAWDCKTDMAAILRDYAQQIIFRAYVHAKHRIPLSKTPSDPNGIEVSIGGRVLPGNTGSATDKWVYDAATNEVLIRWHLIDMAEIKPGEMIVIKYKTR